MFEMEIFKTKTFDKQVLANPHWNKFAFIDL